MQNIILKNANIYTKAGKKNSYLKNKSIAVSSGRISIIDDFDIIKKNYPSAEVIDLKHKTVMPGFIDSHIHLLQTGYLEVHTNLSGVTSIKMLKEKIKRAAKEKAPGEWIIGTSFDETNFVEGRSPNRYDLDEAAPFNPVFLIRACTHMFVANSIALEIAGINKNTPSPEGGIIVRDTDGKPNGILKENAADKVYNIINNDHNIQKESLRAAIRQVKKYGITSVHDMAIGVKDFEHYLKLLDIYQEVLREEDFPLRISLGVEHHLLDDILDNGIKFLQGNEFFRQGYIKFFADGSFGGRTALLKKKYQDKEGYGLAAMEEEYMRTAINKASKNGYQCTVHALGDEALNKVLNIFYENNTRELRHRVVHAGITDDSLIKMLQENNIGVDFQPNFLSSEAHWIQDVLCEDHLKDLYRWKSMVDKGVLLAAGSDSPVEPINPFLGIRSAVLRQNLDLWPSEGFNPKEKLSVEDMLQAYTYNAAYQYFEEDCKGSIETGNFADLIVLSKDPFDTVLNELDQIEVLMSFVSGQLVYQKKSYEQGYQIY
ncbi:amidohydrolase [Natranaerofaba carboxydovora]|uniref:amidohydrolase n=1 Tax=Natranaerofaba carboxydovora TaxID=2742683 RepID=UPI001F13B89D|nr:amidohydrolase [Natranaerofaba carboxydovora]UMZ75483.1 N-substituted formamide deformylase [Natranaerofaba carboxydovora]